MPRNVVVIGASAGGVDALRTVVGMLPADLPATVLVVLHVPPYGVSVLPQILDRSGALPARHAVSGDRLLPGQVLVAPPDHHLVVDGDRVMLSRGPRENGHRPAVDVLFRTAAETAGSAVVAVVLSGALDDGAAGLIAVRRRSGAIVVQDPAEAMYPGMPTSALQHVTVDHVGPVHGLAFVINRLVRAERGPSFPSPAELPGAEPGTPLVGAGVGSAPDPVGTASAYSCPDCGGPLLEVADGGHIRYRCRVGHVWSSDSLIGEQTQQIDAALWVALRALEEKCALARALAARATERQSPLSARRFQEQAERTEESAGLIRALLESRPADRPGVARGPVDRITELAVE